MCFKTSKQIIFIYVFIFCLCFNLACDDIHNNDDTNDKSNKKRVIVKYNVTIVPGQFIIQFNGRYPVNARQKYINAALHSKRASTWWQHHGCHVVPRNNPMAGLPSDFDLLSCDKLSADLLAGLRDHPLIKSVTHEKSMTRSLLEVPDEDDGKDHGVLNKNPHTKQIIEFLY